MSAPMGMGFPVCDPCRHGNHRRCDELVMCMEEPPPFCDCDCADDEPCEEGQ